MSAVMPRFTGRERGNMNREKPKDQIVKIERTIFGEEAVGDDEKQTPEGRDTHDF